MNTINNQIPLPERGNFKFLPVYYFLPEAYVNSCPTLPKLSRSVHEIIESPKMVEIVESIQFLNEVMDAVAALIFPHFGVRGWKEDYSGDFPVWRLSYCLDLWRVEIEKVTGWGWKALSKLPVGAYLQFLTHDYVDWAMSEVVKRVKAEQNLQPILDLVKEIPCEEDYILWRDSRVRKDWIRKWYHTRAKIKMTSLEDCFEDPNSKIHRIGDDNKVSLADKV